MKVALSGDGGDELFGGYESFFLQERLRWADRIPGAARLAIARLAEVLPYSAYGKNYLRMIARPTALERYFESNYAPYFIRERLLQPRWMLPADGAYLTRTLAECLLPGDADVLLQAFYFEETANLTGDMLVKVDRMSMANSLEVRCPLLDHRLAEMAAAFPPSWKIRNGKGKRILIEALGDRLPAALLSRPKKGFGVPLSAWFRGELYEYLRDHLLGRRFLDRGFVSPDFVRYLLEEHRTGRRDNAHWLWRLLALDLWCADYLPGVPRRAERVPCEGCRGTGWSRRECGRRGRRPERRQRRFRSPGKDQRKTISRCGSMSYAKWKNIIVQANEPGRSAWHGRCGKYPEPAAAGPRGWRGSRASGSASSIPE